MPGSPIGHSFGSRRPHTNVAWALRLVCLDIQCSETILRLQRLQVAAGGAPGLLDGRLHEARAASGSQDRTGPCRRPARNGCRPPPLRPAGRRGTGSGRGGADRSSRAARRRPGRGSRTPPGVDCRELGGQFAVGRQIVGRRLRPLVDEAVVVGGVGVDPGDQPQPLVVAQLRPLGCTRRRGAPRSACCVRAERQRLGDPASSPTLDRATRPRLADDRVEGAVVP